MNKLQRRIIIVAIVILVVMPAALWFLQSCREELRRFA